MCDGGGGRRGLINGATGNCRLRSALKVEKIMICTVCRLIIMTGDYEVRHIWNSVREARKFNIIKKYHLRTVPS